MAHTIHMASIQAWMPYRKNDIDMLERVPGKQQQQIIEGY